MSLDLNVYLSEINDELIPKWIEAMNQFEMKCEIHPDFSFSTQNGFLPFKVVLSNSKNRELVGKELITGFEFYKEEFDLQTELLKLQPKRSLFQRLINRSTDNRNYVNDNIDAKLKSCKWVLTFNWGSNNSLELRMAALSSSIITKLANGVCSYPADDIWYDNETIVDDAFKESVEYEDSLKPNEWRVHEFKGWNE